jgi:hypothetical protein
LDQSTLEATEKLLQRLDAGGWSIEAVAWILDPDADEWKLFVASPEVTERGSQAVYLKLLERQDALFEGLDLDAQSVHVVAPGHWRMRQLHQPPREVLRRMEEDRSSLARFRRVSDGFFFADAYVYRFPPAK